MFTSLYSRTRVFSLHLVFQRIDDMLKVVMKLFSVFILTMAALSVAQGSVLGAPAGNPNPSSHYSH